VFEPSRQPKLPIIVPASLALRPTTPCGFVMAAYPTKEDQMRNALAILLASVALMTATTLSTPAAAKGATLKQVAAACGRTAGCSIIYCGEGCASGSTKNVSFTCNDGKCVGVPLAGSRKPITGSNLIGLLNPSVGPQPKGKGPVSAGGGQPVTIGRTNNPVHSSGGGGTGKK
jgi:hypothetical protein